MPFYYTPDISDKLISNREGFRSTEIIFGVLLIDDFTKREPIGKIKVKLTNGENINDVCDDPENNIRDNYKCGKRNKSGYYFFRTPIADSRSIAEKYFIRVESDLYFDITKEEVSLSKLKKTNLIFFDKGPEAKSKKSTLIKISDLERGNVIEFQNPAGATEQRKITEIEENKKTYLFSWAEIPGNDNGRLIRFLKENIGIDWVTAEGIEKVDNNTRKLSFNDHYLFIRINDEKTRMKLEIDDGRSFEFNVETENGKKLNIYKKTVYWIDGLEHDFSVPGSTVVALRDPIKKIVLMPKSAYPFPADATIIRGRILNIDPGAPPVIKVEGGIETKTDERGEFVLYLKGIKAGDKISIEIIKNDKSKKFDITIQKEKETIVLGVISFP